MEVNLDALIIRADFDDEDDAAGSQKKQWTNSTLSGLIAHSKYFRKPDFQRETNRWTKEHICDLIESFLSNRLIPTIILWRNSGGLVFIIDGAHRLSALLAWVNDDYGNGDISRKFYTTIPEDIQNQHETTKKYIEQRVGSYKKPVAKYAHSATESTIEVQWMGSESLAEVESAFFTINQQGVILDDTEIALLHMRESGSSIASRAIVRGGAGHKYWSNFSVDVQKEIELLSKSIHKILFKPIHQYPIKTINQPIGGSIGENSSLGLVFDLVNICNELPTGVRKKYENKSSEQLRKLKEESRDVDGTQTIKYLKEVFRIIKIICAEDPSSLGLLVPIYFYSSTGKHQPSTVLGIAKWIMDMDKSKANYEIFLRNRARMESFLIEYKTFINQTVLKYGNGLRSYKKLAAFYSDIVDTLEKNKGLLNPDVYEELKRIKSKNGKATYTYLNPIDSDRPETTRENFSDPIKSYGFLQTVYNAHPLKCPLCNGYIDEKSSHSDHIQPKSEKGKGTVDNHQIAHYKCGSLKSNNASKSFIQ